MPVTIPDPPDSMVIARCRPLTWDTPLAIDVLPIAAYLGRIPLGEPVTQAELTAAFGIHQHQAVLSASIELIQLGYAEVCG